MGGVAILILVVIFFWFLWPVVSRWLKRKAMEKAEDYMRASMGMPPRDKSKKGAGNTSSQSTSSQSYRRNPYGHNQEPLIPKEYAEDVEFTETKDYSATETRSHSGEKIETYHESQISDAEWTEVKKPRTE